MSATYKGVSFPLMFSAEDWWRLVLDLERLLVPFVADLDDFLTFKCLLGTLRS